MFKMHKCLFQHQDNLKELLILLKTNHFHTYVKYFKVLIDYWVQYSFIHLYLKTIFTLEDHQKKHRHARNLMQMNKGYF